MARKISVIGISGTPENCQLKKSVAQMLVRRLLAEWVIKNLTIRRLAVRSVSLPTAPAPRIDVIYIPDILPPAEVPNCYFKPPSPQPWQLPLGIPTA